MQHVPGKDEPDKRETCQRDQGIGELAPEPTISLLPRAEAVIQGGQRAQDSNPAHELNDSQQGIETRA